MNAAAETRAYRQTAPFPPTVTRREAPPVVIATARLVPPFLARRGPQLRVAARTISIEQRTAAPATLQLQRALARPTLPVALPPPAAIAPGLVRRDALIDQIAHALEQIAGIVRERGLSALSMYHSDPLAQRVLRAIADHIAQRGFL